MSWIYDLIYGTKDKEIEDLKKEVENLNLQIPKQNPKEEYYNTKYSYANISYKRIDKISTNSIDVRQFLNKNNFGYPTFTGTDDEIALACLTWVIKNIIYTQDSTQYKIGEYWAFGYETLNTKKGDCEDGAILLYDLMSYNKILPWKIRVSAGDVINPNTKKKEGHAYVTYYCEEKDYWVVLDWCYLPNKFKINERIEYKEELLYGDVWFSFNENHSWSEGLNTGAKELLNIKSHKK